MIEISPAILTTDKDQLALILDKYLQAGFDSIDIDIQEEGFVSNPTLTFEEALAVVEAAALPAELSLGWDLKVKQPRKALEALVALADKAPYKIRTYVYSVAEIDFLPEFKLNHHVGVGVLGGTGLRGIDFYKNFPEVQIMTINSETQGSKLSQKLLDRTTRLREMGYTGAISIDGGVNLRSAELINAYAKEIRIDRVSVGSYFQKSDQIDLDKQKLQLALNI